MFFVVWVYRRGEECIYTRGEKEKEKKEVVRVRVREKGGGG